MSTLGGFSLEQLKPSSRDTEVASPRLLKQQGFPQVSAGPVDPVRHDPLAPAAQKFALLLLGEAEKRRTGKRWPLSRSARLGPLPA